MDLFVFYPQWQDMAACRHISRLVRVALIRRIKHHVIMFVCRIPVRSNQTTDIEWGHLHLRAAVYRKMREMDIAVRYVALMSLLHHDTVEGAAEVSRTIIDTARRIMDVLQRRLSS